MMQHLLAERLALKLHTESKEFPAYELVVAKGGPKFQVTRKPGFPEAPKGRPFIANMNSMVGGYGLVRLRAQQQPVAVLAKFPLSFDGVPVVDHTGLTGTYDFTLEYTFDWPGTPGPTEPPSAPGLATALREQLGLQWIKTKAPFDVLVIEHVDRTPSVN